MARRMPRPPESFRLWSRNTVLSAAILRSAPLEYDMHREESVLLRRDIWEAPIQGVRCMLEIEDAQLGLPTAQYDLYAEDMGAEGKSMFIEEDGAWKFRGVQSIRPHVFYPYSRHGLVSALPTGELAGRLKEAYRGRTPLATHAKIVGELLTANSVIANVSIE